MHVFVQVNKDRITSTDVMLHRTCVFASNINLPEAVTAAENLGGLIRELETDERPVTHCRARLQLYNIKAGFFSTIPGLDPQTLFCREAQFRGMQSDRTV